MLWNKLKVKLLGFPFSYLTYFFTISLIFSGSVAYADPSAPKVFKSDAYQFSLSVPDTLEVVTTNISGVAVLLRAKKGGYPSFNVVVVPGGFDPKARKKSVIIKDLLNEYTKAGISEVSVKGSFFTKIGQRASFCVQLGYVLAGDSLESIVCRVAGAFKHYVLTFIVPKGKLEQERGVFESLVASVRFLEDGSPGSLLNKSQKRAKNGWGYQKLIFLGLLALGLAFLGGYTYRTKRSR